MPFDSLAGAAAAMAPQLALFERLGFMLREGFLNRDETRLLSAQMSGAPGLPAMVRDKQSGNYVVDEETRRTRWSSVPAESVDLVENRLRSLRPHVSQHFGLELRDIQPVQFLVYRTGDFFHRHQDTYPGKESAEFSQSRKVSIVVFVNQQNEGAVQSDGYEGGDLIFYGAMRGTPERELIFKLPAKPGLLIAFPADVAHEVTPVKSGERQTLVTWFA